MSSEMFAPASSTNDERRSYANFLREKERGPETIYIETVADGAQKSIRRTATFEI
jgi:hypothetical protein